ncbi:MAG: nuclear transport factor 2 family protein [Chloroflexi bacterium]|nr:nuclear transport factor 2 family protein [Chloroflexota bacterium]
MADFQSLQDIESIKALKHKYFRCLDSKLWDDLAECFAEDAVTSFTDGAFQLQGRKSIIQFLRAGLGRETFFGIHHGHHPEIEIQNTNSATGIWSARFYMIDTQGSTGMHSGAIYYDEYVKVDGEWKISSTGYQSIFEETWDRGDIPSLELTKNMFAITSEVE